MATSKKTTQRRTSRLVADEYLRARDALSHLSPEKLAEAEAEFERSEAAAASAPEHVRVIRTLGVLGALRGHTDDQIARLVRAKRMARRELERPDDFVSAGAFAAAQRANATGSSRPESDDYSRAEICALAKRAGYFELPSRDRRRRLIRERIVIELKLSEGNRSTSPESRDRHIRRILDGG